jgi:hypothetical protein
MASLKKELKLMRIMVALLSIVIVGLVLYILSPAIKTAIYGQPFGSRLTGISTPISASQLSTINNASNSYFEIAGEKLLNLSLPGEQASNGTYTASLFEASVTKHSQADAPLINGKPSVIYIGAISCIYCGENRWAMALALSRFGSFGKLYTGYSSFGDGDLPTLYWNAENYTSNGTAQFGNYYQSNYINFISAEYDSPITSGFKFPESTDPITFFTSNSPNASYSTALDFMNNTGMFEGTPFTFWGTSLNAGATGVVFGNATTTNETGVTNVLPIEQTTHSEIFDQLQSFNSTFAYEEYAVADIYVAELCPSINNNASVCSLPAIKEMETMMGLA